jgi:GRIP and coiled-coil domain-containing protein 1
LSANQDLENQNQIQIKKLKDELDLYKKRILVVEKEKNDELKRQSDNTEILLNTMRIDFKQQLDKSEQDRLKSINDVEKELIKQRERTLKLLAEKDTELDRLKSGFMIKKSPSRQTIDENTTNSHDNSLEAKGSGNTSDLVDNDNESEDLNEKLSNSNLIMKSPNGEIEPNRLLYYNEQNAYKEIELSKLRLLKTDLEYKLKQTNDEHSVDIDRFQNQILVLKQEIERLKLNHSRDEMNGANLEYIKNVVFNFMTTKDNNVKLSMINAITQILQFTKNEKQRLQSISNKLV